MHLIVGDDRQYETFDGYAVTPGVRERGVLKKALKGPTPQQRPTRLRVSAGILIPFTFLLLLWIVGAAFPEQRTWGFSQAAYVPIYLSAVLLALCVLTLMPAVSMRIGALLVKAMDGVDWSGTHGMIKSGIAAVFAGWIFYLLAIPFSFLGDSFLYLAEIIRTADSGQADLFRYNSLLSSIIFLQLGAKLMTLFSIVEVARVFWLITAVCGAAFVYVLMRGARSIANDAADMAIFIGLLLGLGGLILFFGYVEYYAPLFVATLAYAMSLYRAITRGRTLVIPAILLVLSLSLHFLALFYIPSLLLALYQRWLDVRKQPLSAASFWRVVLAGIVLFLGAVAGVILLQIPPLYASLIPLSQQSWTGTYTMLSSYHLIDIVNEFFLVAAVPMALAVGLILSQRRRILFDNHVIQVFLVFMLSLTMLAAVHFPFYGMARDWDIYAPLGIAIAFFSFAVLQSVKLEKAFKHYLAGLVFIWSSVFLTLWCYTNISEASALQRYTDVLRLDETHVHEDFAQYGYLNLKKYYHHKGDEVNSAHALRRMIELRGYPWDIAGFTNFVNAMKNPLAVRSDIDAVRGLVMQKSRDSLLMHVQQGVDRGDSSEYVIDQMFFLKPEISAAVLENEQISAFITAHPELPQCRLLIYALEPPADRRDLREYLSVIEESRSLSEGGKPILSTRFQSGITYVLAQMYQQLQMSDSAGIWYARSYALDRTRPKFLDDYGLFISRDGRYESAARLFQEAIDADSTYAGAYFHLGSYYLQYLRDNETAIQLLGKFIQYSLDPEAKAEVQNLIDRIAAASGKTH